MVVKTAKLPTALDARIRHAAPAAKRRYSSLVRDAIVHGLEKPEAIDVHRVLAGFLGAHEGPVDLSTTKNYVVPSSPNVLVETSIRGALCARRAARIGIAPAKFSHPPFAVFEKPAWA